VPRHAPSPATVALLLLALVPPVALLRSAVRDTVDVPWVDQWTFAEQVAAMRQGTFRFADLWAQHNEHRIPVVKVVLHAMAALSDWDVRWEVAANLIVGIAGLLVVAAMLRRTVPHAAPLLLIFASAAQCSLAQWQNWTWGWQLELLMTEAAAIAVGFALLHVSDRPVAWSMVAIVAAVAGALCSGGGLTLLVIVPLGLLAMRFASRMPIAVIGFAAATSTVTAMLYLSDWHPAIGQPPSTPIAGHMVLLINYAMSVLGGLIVYWDVTLAWRWGAAATAVAVAGGAFAWFVVPSQRPAAVAWLALVAFSIGSALMIAIGRLNAGPASALTSRYTTFAVPLWLAVGPLLTLALGGIRSQRMRAALAAIALATAGMAMAHGWKTWAYGDERMQLRARDQRRLLACIADPSTAPDSCWLGLCWDASFARQRALVLQELHLGPWRH
jgi:hypothetical protein